MLHPFFCTKSLKSGVYHNHGASPFGLARLQVSTATWHQWLQYHITQVKGEEQKTKC